jgi:hypothetical protein
MARFFHLAGDNRKALAGIASPGYLNRRVQAQQIHLTGNIVD